MTVVVMLKRHFKVHKHLFLQSYFCSTSWGSQPYTGGSYTAIGREGSQSDIEAVAAPLYGGPKKKVVSLIFRLGNFVIFDLINKSKRLRCRTMVHK